MCHVVLQKYNSDFIPMEKNTRSPTQSFISKLPLHVIAYDFSWFMLSLSRILIYSNWDCIRTKGLMLRQLTNQGRENEMNFQSFFTHNKHLMYLAETILQNLISLANILKYTIILSKNEIRVENYSLIYCIGSCYVCFKWKLYILDILCLLLNDFLVF